MARVPVDGSDTDKITGVNIPTQSRRHSLNLPALCGPTAAPGLSSAMYATESQRITVLCTEVERLVLFVPPNHILLLFGTHRRGPVIGSNHHRRATRTGAVGRADGVCVRTCWKGPGCRTCETQQVCGLGATQDRCQRKTLHLNCP
jgi:hypothetical protein